MKGKRDSDRERERERVRECVCERERGVGRKEALHGNLLLQTLKFKAMKLIFKNLDHLRTATQL